MLVSRRKEALEVVAAKCAAIGAAAVHIVAADMSTEEGENCCVVVDEAAV